MMTMITGADITVELRAHFSDYMTEAQIATFIECLHDMRPDFIPFPERLKTLDRVCAVLSYKYPPRTNQPPFDQAE